MRPVPPYSCRSLVIGWRCRDSSLVCTAIGQTVVVAKDCLQLIVWDGMRAPIIGAGHGFGGNERIVDSFFGGLNRRQEKGIDPVALQTLRGGNARLAARRAVAFIGSSVRSREGDKNVPGAVGFDRARAAQAETHALCYPL